MQRKDAGTNTTPIPITTNVQNRILSDPGSKQRRVSNTNPQDLPDKPLNKEHGKPMALAREAYIPRKGVILIPEAKIGQR